MKKLIGYRIRKIRENKDYSQDNMGAELGITAGAYAKIERGETDPSATRLIRIAEILGVNINMFFSDLHPVSKVDDPGKQYGVASKNDIEELSNLIKQLYKEIEKLKIEFAGLKSNGIKVKEKK